MPWGTKGSGVAAASDTALSARRALGRLAMGESLCVVAKKREEEMRPSGYIAKGSEIR